MLRCLEGKITGFESGGKRLRLGEDKIRVGRDLREALAWEGVVGVQCRVWVRETRKGLKLVWVIPLEPCVRPSRAMVCMGKSCRKRGAGKTVAALEEAGLAVKCVKCLDRCGEGPNVVLLPGKVLVTDVRGVRSRE